MSKKSKISTLILILIAYLLQRKKKERKIEKKSIKRNLFWKLVYNPQKI